MYFCTIIFSKVNNNLKHNDEYMTQEELIDQLKAQIIEAVSLDDLTPADIDADAPLFVEGLGLDSIDAIELILLLDKKYGIKIEDPQQRKSALKSIRTMAELIQARREIVRCETSDFQTPSPTSHNLTSHVSQSQI